jgi:hypothetical protein
LTLPALECGLETPSLLLPGKLSRNTRNRGHHQTSRAARLRHDNDEFVLKVTNDDRVCKRKGRRHRRGRCFVSGADDEVPDFEKYEQMFEYQ